MAEKNRFHDDKSLYSGTHGSGDGKMSQRAESRRNLREGMEKTRFPNGDEVEKAYALNARPDTTNSNLHPKTRTLNRAECFRPRNWGGGAEKLKAVVQVTEGSLKRVFGDDLKEAFLDYCDGQSTMDGESSVSRCLSVGRSVGRSVDQSVSQAGRQAKGQTDSQRRASAKLRSHARLECVCLV